MARIFRSPAVLMTVYVAVFSYSGPWLGSGSNAHRNAAQIGAAVLLAVLATRGSRLARVLMISYGLAGVFAVFFGSARWGAAEPFATNFLALGCALAQIGLLVSTPMYLRTRPGWSRGQLQADQLLPWPRLWVVTASTAGGLVMALLPFSDGLRETVCSAGGARPASCPAAGYGYPIAYRFATNDLAPRGIVTTAFAADFVLWSLLILLVLYLLQLSRSREIPAPRQRHAVEPAPARP